MKRGGGGGGGKEATSKIRSGYEDVNEHISNR